MMIQMNTKTLLLLCVISTIFIVGFTPVREWISPTMHIYTEIEIEAPVEDVWAVLADIKSYPEWNIYFVQIDGEFAVDAPLMVHIEKPNGESVTARPHMMRIKPSRELTWGGGIRSIFYGEHIFLLEETASGNTRLIHKDFFTGIAVRFVSLDAIDEGYVLMNETLKNYVEAQQ